MGISGASLEEIEISYRAGLSDFRRVAVAIVGDVDGARDAVQDAFVTAVRNRSAFRGEGSLQAWLWRIVVNTARNHRRDERYHEKLPDELDERRNGRVDERAGRVAFAVSRLPERQRLALFLRYYADLDYRTIAHTLEISPGTVGATLHAARAALQQLLAEAEAR